MPPETGTPQPRRRRWGRAAVSAAPQLWLGLFLLLPMLILLKISLSESDILGIGFEPIVSLVQQNLIIRLRLAAYIALLHDQLYLLTYLSSLGYAALTTLACLLLGYPFAYAMARARPSRRPALLMLVMLPFWTSFLIRIYAWKNLLDTAGLVNQLLLWAGVIHAPLHMMFTPFSFMIGMVYGYIPFMILPLYATLSRLDERLLEASADLGATPTQTFWRITVPLSRPGVLAGCALVFIPAVGEYVIPALLAGPSTLNIGRVLWDEFFSNLDWQRASAVAVVMVALILAPIMLFSRAQARAREQHE
ncbi:MAG: ABC transporter permease [Betaproteobacteria bacterium]|nr:ABC transporter permease [Betaproteobacteria bacterium]